jgi:hypothetical protein
MSLNRRIMALGLAVALMASTARAGEVNPYLPEDTEVYSSLNIRQILGSQLIKKVGLDTIRGFLQQSQELNEVLKDLGLDPFKDIDKLISAGPSTGEQDKGLLIIQGRFDVDKFRKRAEKEAKDNKDVVKVQKIKDGQGGEHTVYEVVLAEAIPGAPGNLALFVGFPSNNKTILASPSKDYLITALKVKPDATKAKLKNKEFQEMLQKLEDNQSMSMVMVGEVLTKGQLADAPGAVKDMLAKVATAHGGITLTDGIKIEFSVGTKNAEDAKTIQGAVNNAVNAGIGLAGIAAMNNPQIAPVVDFLKSVKVTSREKIATLKAELTAEDLGKLIPKDQ